MRRRTPQEELRSGVRYLVVGVVVAAGMFVLWWLDITHNTEGDPGDPQLLPILAAVPLGIGGYRVLHARSRMRPPR